MREFATGITVLTTGGEFAHGMTANAFSSVSLDPPLVMCCVARTAVMHSAITGAGHFAVSILGADQESTARYFADRRRPRGPGQFTGVDWRPGPHTGAPLLGGASAWLECRLTHAHEGGDHTIFVGEVLAAGAAPGAGPLLFFGGGYRRVAPVTGGARA
ncbi:flavin reductase family protein [Saccharothrix syringae]|uniref:Flavin reductase n=1 Tax=Saccharothrix syringae TaxID=103733 RepID=A0A5Q0HE35_SACSY|nr:flavin reductase family protein [Saccharothrix syringae]QFZ24546.1 flavin reductase [Saccharothrix syringae]